VPGRSLIFGIRPTFACLLWLLALCNPAPGIDRDRKITQLHHTGWTYTDGAPGEVRALAQTTDGYLWLGTATGLFRFDGIRFQAYKPQSGQAFPQRSVVSLFAVPDGGLWVGYWYGGVSFIKNGTVTDYGKAEGLPSRQIQVFARDRQGAIWIAAGEDGLARLDGSRWTKIGAEWGFTGPVYTVFVDRAGTLWVGTPDSAWQLAEGGHKFQIAAKGLLNAKNFAESSSGKLWMAEAGYGVRAVPLRTESDKRDGPAVLVGSQAIRFDGQGSLWITSAGSGIRRVPYLERLQPPKKTGPSEWQTGSYGVEAFTQEHGLTSDYVYCVLQDREGNVWFGTTAGLDRFRQSSVVSVPLQPVQYRGELPIPSLQSFTTGALAAGDQSALWAAGIGPQVLLKIQNDQIAAQLRDQYVDCAYRDQDGGVWFAMASSVSRLVAGDTPGAMNSNPGMGVYDYDTTATLGGSGGAILRRLKLPGSSGPPVIPHSRAKAMTRDHLGRLWISMESGTFRLEKSGWTSLESFGGPRGTATTAFTDSQGRVWFGFTNTVAMLDGDRIRLFSGKDSGIQVGAVTSIQGKGARIWIGGEFGLAFLDGTRFQPVNASDGTAFGSVSGIVTDAENGLWFSENRGIVHISETQLGKLVSGKVEFESFALLDGLTAELRGSLASPSAVQTSDGRIWFATTKGVAWINPNSRMRNTVPPPVMVESVTANGTTFNTSAALRLPPRTTNLQIAYTATSLTIPERVRFRYKLDGQDTDGQDKEWQEAGPRREAFYTKLGPGSYRFQVIACNNDGVWNESGAILDFSIAEAYYQTLWFRALCGMAALGTLWLLYLLRVQQVTAQIHSRLGERLAERERIARELHDTLLQSIQGLMLHFEAAIKKLPPQEPTRQSMQKALTTANQVLVEGRDRVRDLRSEATSTHELSMRLSSCGEELRQDHNIAFKLTIVGSVRTLNPIVGDEAYWIGREALLNAFRHSQASTIELEIIYGFANLRLSIRDDGRGIDQETLNSAIPDHWGRSGMRERAEKFGGQLSLWSRPGAGTEVDLTIPSRFAYPRHATTSPVQWLKRHLSRDSHK
jgi:signal transduction histidine kinase/ligand-binding sensor domain-containing protein